MALPLVQNDPSPEYYSTLADRLPVSGWDQLVTTFEAESERTVVSQLATRNELFRLESEEGQRELSVDELNDKYKDIGLRFDGPQKERVAEYIAQTHRERTYLEQKIASGPQGYTSLIGRFGAGVVAHALDPVETGLTFATGGLLRLGAAAVFGRSVAPSLLGRVGVGAAEGALTQAAIEPLNYSTLKKLQEDYTSAESLYNIAIGAAFGGIAEGAGYGLQKFIDRKKGSRPGAELLSHEAAIAQLLDGKKVDPSGVSADVAAELSRRIPRVSDFSGRMDYQYRPYDPLAGDGRKFYIGTMSENEALSAVERTRRGFQGFVDDAGRANADAASKYNETIGNVFEVELGDARLVNVDQKFGDNEIRILSQELRKIGLLGVADEIEAGRIGSIRELFDVAEKRAIEAYGKLESHLRFSAVRDESGKLKKVYHGTPFPDAAQKGFSKKALAEGKNDPSGIGFFFSESPIIAGVYTESRLVHGPRHKVGDIDNIIPAFLDIRNPIKWNEGNPSKELLERVISLFEESELLSIPKNKRDVLSKRQREILEVFDEILNNGHSYTNQWWARKLLYLQATFKSTKKLGTILEENITENILKPLGFDGARGYVLNPADADQWIAFDESQIVPVFSVNRTSVTDAAALVNANNGVEQIIEKLGFDGYFRNMGDHNAIELFDSAVKAPVKEDGRVVYRQTGVFKGDEAIVPGITAAEREAIIARRKAVETESFYNQNDMDHADAAEELGSIDEEAVDAAELQKFNEVKREIDQMDKAGLLGDDERKLIEQMDELDQKHKNMMTKFKSAIDCVWRNS